MVNIIEVKNVSKSFRKKPVIKDISLNIIQGEFVILKGANGSGKTTLLNIILGLIKPAQGKVLLFNESPENPTAKNSVGVVLQKVTVPRNTTVKELINLFRSYYPTSKSTEDIIEAVKLSEKQENWASNLSGGQEQRLYFALALAGNPRLLILDEPTRNLDEEGYKEFWNQIKKCKEQGITILMVTNSQSDWQELDQIATRMITLQDCSFKEDKSLQDIPKTLKPLTDYHNHNQLLTLVEQTKFESLQLLRNPVYLLGLFTFSGLAIFIPNGSKEYMLMFSGISLILFSVIRIGERIATERIEGWLKLLRITPLSPRIYLTSKMFTSSFILVLILSIIFAIGAWRLNIEYSLTEWSILFCSLILGVIPFMLLGIALGYLVAPKSLNVMTAFIIPLAILTSSDQFISYYSQPIKDLILFSPFYHYGKLALWAADLNYGGHLLLHIQTLFWFGTTFYFLARWAYQQNKVLE